MQKRLEIFVPFSSGLASAHAGFSEKNFVNFIVKRETMKHLNLLIVFLLSAFLLQAQTSSYNVVFDLTSKDTNAHKTVLRWMNSISKEHPDAQMEVVLYGQSLDMVQKGKSSVSQQLQELSDNKNLSVKVCAAAMKRQGIEPTALLPNVDIVPDGIYEIVSKQRQGWGYIKVAQ